MGFVDSALSVFSFQVNQQNADLFKKLPGLVEQERSEHRSMLFSDCHTQNLKPKLLRAHVHMDMKTCHDLTHHAPFPCCSKAFKARPVALVDLFSTVRTSVGLLSPVASIRH